MTAAEQTNTALSAEEMDQFRTQGFLGPFALCSPEEMGATRPAIEAVLESEPPDHRQIPPGALHSFLTLTTISFRPVNALEAVSI